jgi:hypothetical protein
MYNNTKPGAPERIASGSTAGWVILDQDLWEGLVKTYGNTDKGKHRGGASEDDSD